MTTFDVLHTLGKGHNGVVKAVRMSDGSVCAAKFIHVKAARAVEHIQRCHTEVQLQDRSHCEQVCRVLDGVVVGDHFVIVQELLSGGDLSQLIYHGINHGRRLLPAHHEALVQVAKGLEHCHARGVVHGDVKPSNILFSSTGAAKLIDFGCAEECSDGTSGSTRPKGTVPYTAPELWMSREHGSAVDVWAFGVTLYRTLDAGNYPFPHLDLGSPQFLDCYARLPDFDRHMPSARHADLVRRMLSREPASRPSAAQVSQELVDLSSQ